ncbi:DMT family transporter (plasmid) [Micromonospora zamorensis]|uniref:DMT family transporter n=1 Tax=Micromonospora zamorensis TaxID=709883 RepID=UPI002E20C7D1
MTSGERVTDAIAGIEVTSAREADSPKGIPETAGTAVKAPVLLGMGLCAAVNLMLGASIAMVRLLLSYPLFAGQAMRYAIAAAVLLPTLVAVGLMARRDVARSGERLKVAPAEWAWLALLAAAGLVGYNMCLVTALEHADAAVVSSVVGAVPLAVGIVAPLLRQHLPSRHLVMAAVIVVGGTILVHGAGQGSLLGVGFAIGALAGDSAFALVADKVLPRLGPVRVATYTCLLAVPMLLSASIVAGEPTSWRVPNATEWLVLAGLGVLLTAVGFCAFFRGIQMASVERAALTVGLVPLGTVLAMIVQDGAVPPAVQLAGVGVVVLGLIVGASAPAPSPRHVRPMQAPAPAFAPDRHILVADADRMLAVSAHAAETRSTRHVLAVPAGRES